MSVPGGLHVEIHMQGDKNGWERDGRRSEEKRDRGRDGREGKRK